VLNKGILIENFVKKYYCSFYSIVQDKKVLNSRSRVQAWKIVHKEQAKCRKKNHAPSLKLSCSHNFDISQHRGNSLAMGKNLWTLKAFFTAGGHIIGAILHGTCESERIIYGNGVAGWSSAAAARIISTLFHYYFTHTHAQPRR
jgi:hypothetical protein